MQQYFTLDRIRATHVSRNFTRMCGLAGWNGTFTCKREIFHVSSKHHIDCVHSLTPLNFSIAGTSMQNCRVNLVGLGL